MHLPNSISEYTKLFMTSGHEGLRAIIDSTDYNTIDSWIHCNYEWLWSYGVIHSLRSNDEEDYIRYVLVTTTWYTRRRESLETYKFLMGKLDDNT